MTGKRMTALIGTCGKMCPVSEMEQHKLACSRFEADASGKFCESLAIKRDHRSCAGKITVPVDVRPLQVLQDTVVHIMKIVAENERSVELYGFVESRFRAVRYDLMVQDLSGPSVIKILETIALFFVWSGVSFRDELELLTNRERVRDVFTALDEQYVIIGECSERSEFFRILHLLFDVGSDEFMSRVVRVADGMSGSRVLRTAMRVRQAVLRSDIGEYSRLLREIPVQMAAVVVQGCSDMWLNVGMALRKGVGSRQFGKGMVTDFMGVRDEDAAKLCRALKLEIEGEMLRYRAGTPEIDEKEMPRVIAPEWLVNEMSSCREFMALSINTFN